MLPLCWWLDFRWNEREMTLPADPGAGKVRVSATAAMFGALALAGSYGYDYSFFRIVLTAAALLHLWVVTKWYPRLDTFFSTIHYAILGCTFLGVLVQVLRYSELGPGAMRTTLDFCKALLTDREGLVGLAQFLLVAGVVVLGLLLLLGRSAAHGSHRRLALRAGLFAASILLFACDFAIYDPLSKVGATHPERSHNFVFASGVTTLTFPLVFHALVLSWLGYLKFRRARGSALEDAPQG